MLSLISWCSAASGNGAAAVIFSSVTTSSICVSILEFSSNEASISSIVSGQLHKLLILIDRSSTAGDRLSLYITLRDGLVEGGWSSNHMLL